MIKLRAPIRPESLGKSPAPGRKPNALKFGIAMAVLLMAAIFSLAFSLPSSFRTLPLGLSGLTGFATSGSAGIGAEVLDTVSIRFFDNASSEVDRFINFGSGYVNPACDYCQIDTEGNADQYCCMGDWASGVNDYLLLENTGNVGADVTFHFTQDAASLFPLSAPSGRMLMFRAEEKTQGSCPTGLNTTWTEINSSMEYNVCDHLSYSSGNNSVKLYFRLRIPKSSRNNLMSILTYAVAEVSQYEYN